MGQRFDTITFLSDYGTADEFVGVVRSVIRSIAPDVTVVDLTHEIRPHDIRAGGLTLARSAQYLMPGVVVAVVDPGVGGERRDVAVEVGDGESVLVGPDNGLLAPAVGMVGGATRAVELTNPDYQLEAPGATFAGRDIYAPAAAHLCLGVELDDFGAEIDPAGLRPGVVALSRSEGDTVVAQVLWIDRFGNAQLNVEPDQLAALGEPIQIRTADITRNAVAARSFADLAPGEVGLVTDSYGLVAIALNQRSAAEELALAEDGEVVLAAADGADGAGPTPVELSPSRAEDSP